VFLANSVDDVTIIWSLVGMFVYMLEISNDANFSSGAKGICEISFVSWIEF